MTQETPSVDGCDVCAALLRQLAEARASGSERCVRECEAELAGHHHPVV